MEDLLMKQLEKSASHFSEDSTASKPDTAFKAHITTPVSDYEDAELFDIITGFSGEFEQVSDADKKSLVGGSFAMKKTVIIKKMDVVCCSA